MKSILFSFMILATTVALQAQDIKVKKIKKVRVEQEIRDYSFSDQSNRMILSTASGQKDLQYNLRTGRSRSVGEKSVEDIAAAPAQEAPVVAKAAGRKIKLVRQGGKEITTLAPAGEYLYVWISLSPDGKRLLFNAVGKGTFISDLEGNILYELGTLNAPKWMNNQWVVGMNDQDDGHQVTSSDIIAVHANSGHRKNLSKGSGIIAMYPKSSGNQDRIAFTNQKGEVFTMKIKIKE